MTTAKSSQSIKVCYVLSYRAPNYTRTAALVNALESLPNVELTIIKNHATGVARYGQTFIGLVKYRMRHKPDVFMLGFRGQEVFGFFYPFMRGRPIIFDEFINHHDWIVDEHGKFGPFGKVLVTVLDAYMRWVVRHCAYVLEDTPAHAQLSRELYQVPAAKIVPIPVGADETVFKPQDVQKKSGTFEVFFYGNMLPLHGFEVILEAVKRLGQDGKLGDMHFTLVGGKGKPAMMRHIASFIASNQLETAITHLAWANYEKLPGLAATADVCLSGPFGGTGQAMRVVTGKTYQFMAVGAPTIIGATDNVGIFHDKQDCIIVEQQDPAALAAALLWCQAHPKELQAIGLSGRRLFEERFSSHVIAETVRELLLSVTPMT